MNKQMKRSRLRRMMAVGALVGTLVSVGAISDSASAAKKAPSNDTTVTIDVGPDGGGVTMMSGVRW